MNQKAESKKTENQLNRPVMAAAMVTAFVTTFMSSALNLSIPALESYFHVSAATVSWVVSTYTMAVAAMSLPFGKLADAAGMKKVFLTGIAGFGILSLVSPFSANIGFLLICRTLQGACGAMMFATNNSILIKAHPREMQGRVLGLSVAATYAGLTLGPALGGVLNRTLGWKAIFILSAGTAAVAYFVSTKGVPADEKTVKEIKTGKIDKAGALLYVTAVVTSLYGLTDFTVSVRARFILAAGVILIAGFFHRETKAENPLMKVSMFTTSRTFTFSNLAALLNYGATFAITYEVSIYLQMVKGFSSDKAGMILIFMPAVQALLSPKMGALSDRIRPSLLASGGMGLCAVALVMLALLPEKSPTAYIIAVLCLAGLGFAMFSSPNNNAIMSCVHPSDYGVANSIIATMRTYGQSSGMAVLNIVTGAVLGKGTYEGASAAVLMKMIHLSFFVFAIVCFAGIGCSMARDKRPGAATKNNQEN